MTGKRDLVVIGGGPGGLVVASVAAQADRLIREAPAVRAAPLPPAERALALEEEEEEIQMQVEEEEEVPVQMQELAMKLIKENREN